MTPPRETRRETVERVARAIHRARCCDMDQPDAWRFYLDHAERAVEEIAPELRELDWWRHFAAKVRPDSELPAVGAELLGTRFQVKIIP